MLLVPREESRLDLRLGHWDFHPLPVMLDRDHVRALLGEEREQLAELTRPVGDSRADDEVATGEREPMTHDLNQQSWVDVAAGEQRRHRPGRKQTVDIDDPACDDRAQIGDTTWEEFIADGDRYAWDPASTYIARPSFFEGLTADAMSGANGDRMAALAAGGLLAMLTNSLAAFAYERGGELAGVATVVGSCAALIGSN